MLNKVKILIFPNDEYTKSEEELLETIAGMVEQKVLERIRRKLPFTEYIPDELEYLLVEMIVERYNRLGSEGMTSESVEGHSVSYTDDEYFLREIDDWLDVQALQDD